MFSYRAIISYLRDVISPFVPDECRNLVGGVGAVSFGTGSFGYDMRLAPIAKVFSPGFRGDVDPKRVPDDLFVETDAHADPTTGEHYFILQPGELFLGASIEHIAMPKDVIALAVGKSTYARYGIIANVTPIEPGWQGHLTIELANTGGSPVRVYANDGVVQLLFFLGNMTARIYAGKYQDQAATPTESRVL